MKLVPRINPVTLKEIRQLVRSRLIVWGMVALPAITLLVTALTLVVETSNLSPVEAMYGQGLGTGPLAVVSAILGFVVTGAIPLFAAIKTILETSKGTTSLEYTTTLTPPQIVSGKIVAVAVISGIATALSMPFFVLSYLMRGIELGTTILTPILTLAGGIAMFSVLLLPACARKPVPLRIIAVLAMYMFLPMSVGAVATVLEIAGDTGRGIETAGALATVAFIFVACCMYCRAQAAAELAPPHLDSVRPLRYTQAILFVLSIPFAFWYLDPWATAWGAIAVMIMVRAACYPAPLPRGAVLHAQRSWPMRAISFPFASGSVPSMVFASILAAVAAGAMAVFSDDPSDEVIFAIMEFAGVLTIAGSLGRMVASRHPRLGALIGRLAIVYIILTNSLTVFTSAAEGFSRKQVQWMLCNFDGIVNESALHAGNALIATFLALLLLALATVRDFHEFRKP